MKTKRIVTAPSHTEDVFNPQTLPGIVEWASHNIITSKADAIVVCGHSGLIVAGAVAAATGVPIFAVRKEGEPCQGCTNRVSAYAPEGKAQRWVWLDDFISSGHTFRTAAREIWKEGLVERPYPVALLHYRHSTQYPTTYELGGYTLGLHEVVPDYRWSSSDPSSIKETGYDPK